MRLERYYPDPLDEKDSDRWRYSACLGFDSRPIFWNVPRG